MPRVNRKRKNRAGAERHCGRCGKKIEPGEGYLSWSFRYGGTYYRCLEHPPRPSDLTQSKLSEVYRANEDASDGIPTAADADALAELIDAAAETARTVADEYEEAAEHFGGEGENRERADEVGEWADELENWYPDEDAAIADLREEAERPDLRVRAMNDPRKFDGPFDKQEMRRTQRLVVDLVKSDLHVRVPLAEPDDEKANHGRMERADAEPGDTGYRWRHLYIVNVDREGKEPTPVSFDAGSCALWVSPGGWRLLMCWHHDDPTYGLNLVVFDPWGDIHAEESELDGRALDWVDQNLP